MSRAAALVLGLLPVVAGCGACPEVPNWNSYLGVHIWQLGAEVEAATLTVELGGTVRSCFVRFAGEDIVEEDCPEAFFVYRVGREWAVGLPPTPGAGRADIELELEIVGEPGAGFVRERVPLNWQRQPFEDGLHCSTRRAELHLGRDGEPFNPP